MTPAQLTAAFFREYRPANGIIPLDAACANIIADAIEEADDSHRSTVELYAPFVVSMNPPYYDTRNIEPIWREYVEKAVAYLIERGLIERGPEPHLVRFPDTKVGA